MASPSLSVSVDDVRAAQDLLAGVVRPTPLEYSRALTDRVGCEVFHKCENLQRAGSFKIRGAYTRMARLSDEEKARGVVAASAGNHAQGVALAGQLLGIKVKVYMPHGAPMPKLLATEAYGATIEQVGTTIDECLVEARRWEAEEGAVLIHPFDHPDIVAGQSLVLSAERSDVERCALLDRYPDVSVDEARDVKGTVLYTAYAIDAAGRLPSGTSPAGTVLVPGHAMWLGDRVVRCG